MSQKQIIVTVVNMYGIQESAFRGCPGGVCLILYRFPSAALVCSQTPDMLGGRLIRFVGRMISVHKTTDYMKIKGREMA